MQAELFNKYLSMKPSKGNERSIILEDILNKINQEIKEKPYYLKENKKIKLQEWTYSRLAKELQHLKEISELTYLDSICKSYKSRGGSYTRCMRGAIKVKV